MAQWERVKGSLIRYTLCFKVSPSQQAVTTEDILYSFFCTFYIGRLLYLFPLF